MTDPQHVASARGASTPFGQDIEASLALAWEGLSQEQRLAAAWWLGGQVAAHMNEPGSFRTLVHKRFGFGPEAYLPLQSAGWLEIISALHDAGAHETLIDRLVGTGRPAP